MTHPPSIFTFCGGGGGAMWLIEGAGSRPEAEPSDSVWIGVGAAGMAAGAEVVASGGAGVAACCALGAAVDMAESRAAQGRAARSWMGL
jgi:hypothetical protein